MSDSYINNGNYVYGRNEYDQPTIPQYNSTLYHKKYGIREFPETSIKDDGSPYIDAYHTINYDYCEGCNKCGKLNKIYRKNLMGNLVNIQSVINKVLTITLYGTDPKLDKTINMKIGNKYCVTYATESGLVTITGTFKELSPNMPDDCIRYIGNFTSVTSAAYIGLDCSTAGESDKRLIYIATIRYIQEVFDDDEDPYKDLSQEEKLKLMLDNITSTATNIEEYIKAKKEKEEQQEEEEEKPQKQPLPPPPPPPSGPIIVGARPPFFPPPPPPPYMHHPKPDEIKDPLDSEELMEVINAIKQQLTSFIETYEADKNKEAEEDAPCTCECESCKNKKE